MCEGEVQPSLCSWKLLEAEATSSWPRPPLTPPAEGAHPPTDDRSGQGADYARLPGSSL